MFDFGYILSKLLQTHSSNRKQIYCVTWRVSKCFPCMALSATAYKVLLPKEICAAPMLRKCSGFCGRIMPLFALAFAAIQEFQRLGALCKAFCH